MKSKIFTRRQFLKLSGSATIALGLSNYLALNKAYAAGRNAEKPAVVWMEAQDCTGCTESVLSSLNPDPRDILLNAINLWYHETLMSGTGDVANYALSSAIQVGGYVLVLEGAIPATDKRFITIGGEPLEDKFIEASKNASLVLAIGSCGSNGGIPRATPSNGQGAGYFLDLHNVSVPLINLPGCPVSPTWFFDTLINYLNGVNIDLDAENRPRNIYSTRTIHSKCPRRINFRKRYLTDWNDPSQKGYCLLQKGCKGQWTISNCPDVIWNDGVNWCIGNNAPCSGCTSREFYDGFSPLYEG